MTAMRQILPLKRGVDTTCLLKLLNQSIVQRIRLCGVNNKALVEKIVTGEVEGQHFSELKSIMDNRTHNIATVINQVKQECIKIALLLKDEDIFGILTDIVRLDIYYGSVRQFCDRVHHYLGVNNIKKIYFNDNKDNLDSKSIVKDNKSALTNMRNEMLRGYSCNEIIYDNFHEKGAKDIVLAYAFCVLGVAIIKKYAFSNLIKTNPSLEKIITYTAIGLTLAMVLSLFMFYRVSKTKRVKYSSEEIDDIFGKACLKFLVSKNRLEFSQKCPLLTEGLKQFSFFENASEIYQTKAVAANTSVTVRKFVVASSKS
ncbi:hypothetical protein AYO45_05415 [Gammaproteobacteria bacterium SCGC AG-212-F23]|nr:hypothetical protein AYO45_05415 [Gammaproteobacteria bacterium SCGC AG-212-F23]